MTDIALRLDPATRRFDIAFEGRDLARDRTPATAMILALGCDRRALPDDALPEAPDPPGFGARRGWCGDALDRAGRRLGSRLWLLVRAKETEETRLRAEAYAREALAPLAARRGQQLDVVAVWSRLGVLALTCRLGSAAVTVRQGVAS